MKRMIDPLVQININSEFDSRIEALEDAPAGTSLYLHQLRCTNPAFTLEVIMATGDKIETGTQLSTAYPKFVGVRSFNDNQTPLAFMRWDINPITSGSQLQGIAEGGTKSTVSVSTSSVITDTVTEL